MSLNKINIIVILLKIINQNIKYIYLLPDLTNTSNKFIIFTIDFRAIDTPPATYWSLANFQLDTTDFEKTHFEVSGGGVYSGLQTLSDGSKVSIASFCKITGFAVCVSSYVWSTNKYQTEVSIYKFLNMLFLLLYQKIHFITFRIYMIKFYFFGNILFFEGCRCMDS